MGNRVKTSLKAASVLSLAFVVAACGGGSDDDNDQFVNRDADISGGGASYCIDSCVIDGVDFSNDGECQDQDGSSTVTVAGGLQLFCVLGTDCSDCGPRPAPAPGDNGLSCADNCVFANDNECDDGINGGAIFCPPASDCGDCGPQNLRDRFPGSFTVGERDLDLGDVIESWSSGTNFGVADENGFQKATSE